MKFKNWVVLQERKYRDIENDEGYIFNVYINPTHDEIIKLLRKSRGEVRGFLSNEDIVFVWDANDEIHNKVATKLEETIQIPFYIQESNGYLFIKASSWSGQGDVPAMTRLLEQNPKIRTMLGW